MPFPGLASFMWRTKSTPMDSARDNCAAVGAAFAKGDIGETVTAVQNLIIMYYGDVRQQATEAFESAMKVARFGFGLLVVTVLYVIFKDLMPSISPRFAAHTGGMNVGAIGLIASSVVEVIASVQFVMYGRATRQFGAFHICLERTHRYLLAYEMADRITANKDETLEKIVCIMANAPMITREDIDGAESVEFVQPGRSPRKSPAADNPVQS